MAGTAGLLAPAAIFVATLASRLPFATHYLWAWDSVLYTRALERGFHIGFDLAEQRPHAPGYIFYVASAQLFRTFLADSHAALVLLSMVASAAGAAVVYLVALRFARPSIALVAALAYAASPLVWTYSEVAYPYTLLGLLSVALAWLVRARGSHVGAAFVFGAAAGFRQDLLAIIGPLWVWSLREGSWPARARAVAALCAGSLTWLVPSAALSGGLGDYVSATGRQIGSVARASSVPTHGLDALSANAGFTLQSLGWGLFALAPVALVLLSAHALERLRIRTFRLSRTQAFFAFWIVPGLGIFVLVHIGEWGHVLSILPAMYVALAAGFERAARDMPPLPRALPRAAATAAVLLPVVAFAAGDGGFSAVALERHDRALEVRITHVRAAFPAATTAILAREDFLLVRHYLPEYRAWLYDPEPHARGALKRKRTTGLRAVVIFTDGLRPRRSLDVREIDLGGGVRLSYIPIEPGAVLELYGERYTVRETDVIDGVAAVRRRR